MQTSPSIEELKSARFVRLTRAANGIRLYFPPLRNLHAALGLAAFGAVCVALPVMAIAGLLSAPGSEASGLLAIVFAGAFVVPVMVFGLVFILLALYMAANSFSVEVSASEIKTRRRVLGIASAAAAIRCADIAAIEQQPAPRYHSLFGGKPCYRMIARKKSAERTTLLVAETMYGDARAAEIGNLIAATAAVPFRGPKRSDGE